MCVVARTDRRAGHEHRFQSRAGPERRAAVHPPAQCRAEADCDTASVICPKTEILQADVSNPSVADTRSKCESILVFLDQPCLKLGVYGPTTHPVLVRAGRNARTERDPFPPQRDRGARYGADRRVSSTRQHLLAAELGARMPDSAVELKSHFARVTRMPRRVLGKSAARRQERHESEGHPVPSRPHIYGPSPAPTPAPAAPSAAQSVSTSWHMHTSTTSRRWYPSFCSRTWTSWGDGDPTLLEHARPDPSVRWSSSPS